MLIGPGRWGSRDRFLGVPVRWADINKAKVIIETGLDGFVELDQAAVGVVPIQLFQAFILTGEGDLLSVG